MGLAGGGGSDFMPLSPFIHKVCVSALSVAVGGCSSTNERKNVAPNAYTQELSKQEAATPVGIEQVYQCPGLCLSSSAFVSWNVPMRQSGAAGAWLPAPRLRLWRQGGACDSWSQVSS